ncbi:MAG: hypothetical protein ACI9SB_000426 [Candidatus Azotimanducaceae bacterium]|jgi:hypothetical protein
MTRSIIQIPVLKPLSFFCTDENLAQGEILDDSLRDLSQCRDLGASVEVSMCEWLMANGVQTEPYGWSILANQARSKPRAMNTTLMRRQMFTLAERTIPRFAANVFDQAELVQCARLASHRSGAFRKADVFTTPDRDGARIRFIARNKVRGRIEEILRTINESECDQHTSLRATWVMLAFINCHPYVDGNGRTSKYLFNLVLAKSGISSEYLLPLSTITLGSQGFFNICARRAELQDSFDMILKFLTTAIALTKLCFEKKPYVFQSKQLTGLGALSP